MAEFYLRLQSRQGEPPITESLDATDVVEARTLAEMRLLLSSDYKEIRLYHHDREVGVFQRPVE